MLIQVPSVFCKIIAHASEECRATTSQMPGYVPLCIIEARVSLTGKLTEYQALSRFTTSARRVSIERFLIYNVTFNTSYRMFPPWHTTTEVSILRTSQCHAHAIHDYLEKIRGTCPSLFSSGGILIHDCRSVDRYQLSPSSLTELMRHNIECILALPFVYFVCVY